MCIVCRQDKPFDKKEYYDAPHNFEPIFHSTVAPYSSAVVHCSYWDSKYPRCGDTAAIRGAKEMPSHLHPPRQTHLFVSVHCFHWELKFPRCGPTVAGLKRCHPPHIYLGACISSAPPSNSRWTKEMRHPAYIHLDRRISSPRPRISQAAHEGAAEGAAGRREHQGPRLQFGTTSCCCCPHELVSNVLRPASRGTKETAQPPVRSACPVISSMPRPSLIRGTS